MSVTDDMLKVYSVTIGGFKELLGMRTPSRSIFFQFHAVFGGEMVKIFDFASTEELGPPLGDRGSAPLDLHVAFVSLL